MIGLCRCGCVCVWPTVEGAVFVTGCDSGMGFWSAALLADLGYTVVAGCFLEDSEAKLKAHCKVGSHM